ncbi:hypothetical protein ABIA33_004146 [Streptacidiphilus sp. MAP12-16]|uniref:hypothetical protein n=1 Tax=Streptacidiphilus sp. MAP12-16 TaxID=3156300 RepID=UPI0035142BD1
MTTSTSALGLDSSGHPPVETIAEYLEDLLSPDVTAQLHAHFSDCPECSDTCDAIEEIRSLLGRTETPQLPTDFGIRIDAALAAEALLSSTQPATATPSSEASAPVAGRASAGGDGVPRQQRAATGTTGPADGRPGGTGPGRRTGGTGRRWRQAALGLAALAVAGFIGTAILRTDHGASSATSASAAKGVEGSGRDGVSQPTYFTADGFTGQIQQLLVHGQSKAAPRSQQQEPSTPSTANAPASVPLSTTAPRCVTQAIGRDTEQPLTVSLGSYQGIPVYAVVYADRADPARSVDAYLVDASCTSAAVGTPGHIELQRTVPRG